MPSTDMEPFIVTQLTTNWSTITGGSVPTIVQGENMQNLDIQNTDYVNVYGMNDTGYPFDLFWASRDSKPIVMIQIATGKSRTRLRQMYSEVQRIMENRNYWRQPAYNFNMIDAPDLSREIRLWFEIDMICELWVVEIP